MLKIAITGGIGSGKSYVCRKLEALGYPVFYCDPAAKALIRHDAVVRRRLTALVGDALYDAEGRLVKRVLAAWLCEGGTKAAEVDAIVHPRVAETFGEWAEERRREGFGRVFMECALLFESGFERLVDRTALVVADEATRLRRVMQRDGLDAEGVRRWQALQMPEAEKLRRADIAVRNDDGREPDIAPLLA